jgi:hypothetical protein
MPQHFARTFRFALSARSVLQRAAKQNPQASFSFQIAPHDDRKCLLMKADFVVSPPAFDCLQNSVSSANSQRPVNQMNARSHHESAPGDGAQSQVLPPRTFSSQQFNHHVRYDRTDLTRGRRFIG